MGLKESPPIFTSATETITDLANVVIKEGVVYQAHRLEVVAETDSTTTASLTQPQTRSDTPKWKHIHVHRRVSQWDDYVDDSIGMSQGGASRRKCVKRALLHSLDKMSRGLNSTDGPFRQEPASIKKLLKGDATWATRKVVLGWLLDTTTKTIQLPAHRVE
jgi:hypothetical protein